MICLQVDLLIERYSDGTLSPRRADRVRRHLEGCDRCRMRAARARTVVQAFRVTEVERLSGSAAFPAVAVHRAPKGFTERVMSRVELEARAPGRRGAGGREATRVYRRLAYSFVATAALLAASLFLPGAAYSTLIRPAGLAAELAEGRPAVVARALTGAGERLRRLIEVDTAPPGSGI